MKKIILIIFCALLSTVSVSAQDFDVSLDIRTSDLKNLDKQKLVVEVLSADGRAISKLTKMLKDEPEVLRNYNRFIESYNENIKLALDKYWKLTDTIIYATEKDIKRLKESRERNILILSAQELGGSDEFITRLNGTALQLVFYKLNKSLSEADYKIIMPYSHTRLNALNPLTDYMFTINMAVRNLNYMEDKRTVSNCFDFMETEAMANCKKQEKKTLMIDEELLTSNADSKGIKKYYNKKKVKIIKKKSKVAIEDIINEGSAENSYMLLIPYSTFTNPFGRTKNTYVLCYKVIVDADGGVILNYTKGKTKASPDVSLIQEKDFRDLDECSF